MRTAPQETQGTGPRGCTLPGIQPAPLDALQVTHAGEFEGTPLYAEVGVAAPFSKLFIPLEDDYWQMLTPGQRTGPDTVRNRPVGVPGVD